jgi:hypothetical protein
VFRLHHAISCCFVDFDPENGRDMVNVSFSRQSAISYFARGVVHFWNCRSHSGLVAVRCLISRERILLSGAEGSIRTYHEPVKRVYFCAILRPGKES